MTKTRTSVAKMKERNMAINEALYGVAQTYAIDGETIALNKQTFKILLSNTFVARYSVDQAVAKQYSAGEVIKKTEKLQHEINILWEYARTGQLKKDGK